MASPNSSNAANDAIALLTGAHVDRLSDSIRGANITLTRVETVMRDLIKSNNALVEELKKHRARDRRK